MVGEVPTDEACTCRDQDVLHLCSLTFGCTGRAHDSREEARARRVPVRGVRRCRRAATVLRSLSTHLKATAVPSATASPTEPLDLVLHIGSGKTGTSSVQHLLSKSRERLAKLGTLYPRSPGHARHVRLGLFIRPDATLGKLISWQKQDYSSPTDFREDFQRKLFAEINSSGLTRVLLSDEALYGSTVGALKRLRAFTDEIARSIRLVVYLRRQDDHLCSRYQQVVKTGEVRRLADRVEQLDLPKLYDHHARLRTWARLLEPTDFVVRPFDRERFVDGSLLQDFLDAARIDASALDLTQARNLNESLDAESVEFLRLLNLHRIEHEGAKAGLIDNRALVKRLTEVSTGPTLTLPDSVLDAFMDSWEESNRAVARDFLGDKTGQLFRAPRKTRNTTTEQRLDPARVDDYLALLDLPEQLHEPLRRLAEREARAC
jgi:hypothetical protein